MSNNVNSIFEEGQVLLFDKPLYWTSFDLVNKVKIIIRSTLGIKKIKVGHSGTLDPLASGLMIICTGRATKRIEEFRDLDKEYVATIHLGATTPSFDLETETDGDFPTEHITEELVKGAFGIYRRAKADTSITFCKAGKRAYEYARKGIIKERIRLLFFSVKLNYYRLISRRKIRLRCSKGTYIRSFARDLGQALNSGAYLSALIRTSIGLLNVRDAYNIEKFQEKVELMKQNEKYYV